MSSGASPRLFNGERPISIGITSGRAGETLRGLCAEVALFFAAIGRELRSGGNAVVNEATYTAIVGMVMVTTLIPPPMLSWSMNRHAKGVLTP